uniref:hypothetical protein n=1 Tax=Edaphosphingomonas laterariae TaxID=861865 RepID=UPI000B782BD6|nr:hypothetical protein [Sphingomonas laterariae]
MSALWTAIECIWGVLIVIGILSVMVMVVLTAWTGKFWFGRIGADGKRWPPLRSEAPVKFWLVWLLYGGPLLLVPLLIFIGLVASFSEG